MSEPKSTLKVAKSRKKASRYSKVCSQRKNLLSLNYPPPCSGHITIAPGNYMYFAALARKRGYYTSMN